MQVIRYLVVIPARGGSVGIPGKNLLDLAGKPLLAWTIEHALAAATPCRVVVSTDSEEIATVARTYGAEVPVMRPAALAADEAPTEPAVLHALDNLPDLPGAGGADVDHVVLLQATSPLRRPGALDQAVALYERSEADSLLSVVEAAPFLWRAGEGGPAALYDYARRPRRQDLAPGQRLYRENGSIYITRTAILRQTRNRLGGRIVLYPMSEEEGTEIDDPVHWRYLDWLMRDLASRSDDVR